MAQQDKTNEVIKRLEQGIKDVFNSDKFRNYLKTMSKFHNYSFNNSLLIYMQKPDATLVAGFNSWKKNFKRFVKKGEKGIQILAPAIYKQKVEMEKLDPKTQKPILNDDGKPVTEVVEIEKPFFKPVYVFDISQTDGEPLPQLTEEIKANVENFKTFFKALEKVSPFPIEKEEITSGAKGYCDPVNKRIAIKEGLSEAHMIKTAIHEISHAILHSDLENGDNKTSRTREVEAESIAFIVADHFGIDTSSYSFAYIASWSSDKELNELKESLNTIQKTANSLINDITNAYKELQLHQEIEKSEVDSKFQPVITIEWSEHSSFEKGEKLSIAEANAKFMQIDKDVLDHGDSYYKTRYQIDCVFQGEKFTYSGRFDLGDGYGNLTSHIKHVASSYEPHEPEFKKITSFANYLEQHEKLEQIKNAASVDLARMNIVLNSSVSEQLKNEAEQHVKYNQAVINYVNNSQNLLNNDLPYGQPPNKADFIKGVTEKSQVVNKGSIKDRINMAKNRSESLNIKNKSTVKEHEFTR